MHNTFEGEDMNVGLLKVINLSMKRKLCIIVIIIVVTIITVIKALS